MTFHIAAMKQCFVVRQVSYAIEIVFKIYRNIDIWYAQQAMYVISIVRQYDSNTLNPTPPPLNSWNVSEEGRGGVRNTGWSYPHWPNGNVTPLSSALKSYHRCHIVSYAFKGNTKKLFTYIHIWIIVMDNRSTCNWCNRGKYSHTCVCSKERPNKTNMTYLLHVDFWSISCIVTCFELTDSWQDAVVYILINLS